jgi:twitching motility protein PilT
MVTVNASDMNVAALVETLMREAVSLNASDIHLVAGHAPVMRIDGEICLRKEHGLLLSRDTEAMAKTLASNGRWEQFVKDRELDISVARPGVGRFRVNLYWQLDSVAVALRIIPDRIPKFAELTLPPCLAEFALLDHGLFLVTGPTGSGKSTTLASMVDYINENKSCNIVTIEDPIEYLHTPKNAVISQREMHQDTHSFHEALRRVLRQDPDVILIGELRDPETIQTAMTLAETGHLVLGTLHTVDATQALSRIMDSFPGRQRVLARTQLALVIAGIMSQHLMKRHDGSGRVLAYELLVATQAIRNMIRCGDLPQIYSAIQTGTSEGMSTLNSSLTDLCRRNCISREDALRKSTQPKELSELLMDRHSVRLARSVA